MGLRLRTVVRIFKKRPPALGTEREVSTIDVLAIAWAPFYKESYSKS